MRRPTVLTWIGLLLGLTVAGACGSGEGPRAAEELYADFCSRCHGTDGQGDRKKRRLNPELDLTASRWIADGARAEIRQRIADGHGSMPGFSRKLSAAEIDALAAYLDRFHSVDPAVR